MLKNKKAIIIIVPILIIILLLGIGFYTKYRKEVIRDEHASNIATILKKMDGLYELYDVNNKNIIDDEIAECSKILDELHKENSSGNIKDASLVSIMDNSIQAVENHITALRCYKSGSLDVYSDFAKKSDNNIKQVITELERLGFKN